MKKLFLIFTLLGSGIWVIGIWLLAIPSFAAPLADLGIQPFYMDIGARPQAMGRAFIGVANDENSCFYNPGGLPWSKGITIYGRDSLNIAAAQAYPTGYGSTLGIAVVQSGISSFAATSGQIVDFSSNILVLSAASKLSAIPILGILPQSQNIGIGANVKSILGQTLRVSGAFDRTASGWELDAGVMYKALPWLNFGVVGQNIMPEGNNVIYGGVIRWDTGELEGVPGGANAGLNAKIIGDARSPFYLEGNEVSINADAHMQKNIPGWSSYGIEWNFRGFFYVRAGTYSNSSTYDATCIGAGIRMGGWGIDIASYKDLYKNDKGITFSLLYDPEEWTFEKKPEVKKFETISIKDPVYDLSPPEESVTYNDSVLITGKAKPGVAVSVNSQSVLTDAAGKFVAQVPLNPGKNLVLIEAFLGEGKETYTRKVLKKPKIVIAEEKQLKEEIKKTESKEEQEKIRKDLEQVEQRKQKVEALVTLGVVDLAPQAEFRLEAPVTRGELASWLVKAANIPLPRVTGAVFSDVPVNHPLAPFIKAAVDNNLMQSIGNKFNPDVPVSRAEAQEIFRRFGVIK